MGTRVKPAYDVVRCRGERSKMRQSVLPSRWRKSGDRVPSRKNQGGHHASDIQSSSLHCCRDRRTCHAGIGTQRIGAGGVAVAADSHDLQLSGRRPDRSAGACVRRLHRQAGQSDRDHREQGGRVRLAGRRRSRPRGARWTHHPVLDLDHLCDEPGDDEEPGLRHGQGSDPGQRHPRRRTAAGREPENRGQVAGGFRRLRAQERQGEFRHLQRRLGPAHDGQ